MHSSFPTTSSSIRAWWICWRRSRPLVLFSYIEGILLTNRAFFTLEERQRECRLYVDQVGDLQETHIPHMRVYPDYHVNQANTGRVLQSLRVIWICSLNYGLGYSFLGGLPFPDVYSVVTPPGGLFYQGIFTYLVTS
ncbi:hypothetical protein EDD15DRAFT_869990 [Pisolithus albus]|nr:hypothetical protein EDD15DRAFT_869990 [Pisolithus albus]